MIHSVRHGSALSRIVASNDEWTSQSLGILLLCAPVRGSQKKPLLFFPFPLLLHGEAGV